MFFVTVFVSSSSILCEYLSMFAYKHERINMFACSDRNFESVFVVVSVCVVVLCTNTYVFSIKLLHMHKYARFSIKLSTTAFNP